jgi:dihydrofolate reductase
VRLTALLFTTLDGIYQAPGARDEDRRGGFTHGGWQFRHEDPEIGPFIRGFYERADALLLGRVTWQIWSGHWPLHDDHPLGHRINTLPKHVPSTTLHDPSWAGTRVIEGDVEAAVRALKAQPGRELQVHGSGATLRWLLERGLVDELTLMVHPIVLGEGLRLFPDRGPAYDLELADSRATPAGVAIQRYRPGRGGAR